jgi:hypothetical protein
MSTISSNLTIGLTIMLLIVPVGHFSPMVWHRTGSINIPDTGSTIKSIDSTAGHIVVVQFSVSDGALDFFLVHSDFYDLSGLPDISLCQYHVFAQSARYQFTVDRDGTWYLVFANSPQQQQGTYAWTEYTEAEWNSVQLRNWAIIVICVILGSILVVQYLRSRFAKKEGMVPRV